MDTMAGRKAKILLGERYSKKLERVNITPTQLELIREAAQKEINQGHASDMSEWIRKAVTRAALITMGYDPRDPAFPDSLEHYQAKLRQKTTHKAKVKAFPAG